MTSDCDVLSSVSAGLTASDPSEYRLDISAASGASDVELHFVFFRENAF